MNNESVFNNSIAVIGPKQVGKTFVCEQLANENDLPNFVLSSDLLTNLIVFDISGKWNEFVESTELREIGSAYKQMFNFEKLAPFVQSIASCSNLKDLSPKARKVAMSYWKARLLEEATNKIKSPFILDAGADIGAVYNLSDEEKNSFYKEFFMPYNIIESRLSNFLKQFNTVAYLKPGQTYKTLQGRCKDFENSLYLESGKSYQNYATLTFDCDKIYNSSKPREETIKQVINDISNALNSQELGK